MRTVYVVADNIFSPLGKNTGANMAALNQGLSGISHQDSNISSSPFFASFFSPGQIPPDDSLTPFEQIIFLSARDAMQKAGIDPAQINNRTGFILSTTKGNISLIENPEED